MGIFLFLTWRPNHPVPFNVFESARFSSTNGKAGRQAAGAIKKMPVIVNHMFL